MLRLFTFFVFLAIYARAVAFSIDINGWYPCTLTDESSQPLLNDISFECATVGAPLCHSGTCNSSKTIELFVKRKLASSTPPQKGSTQKSVWFLAGGPGASSADLEMAMLEIYFLSKSSIDVYTMDHRGTGRSSFLDCMAAQATAEGSPGGAQLVLQELPYCVKDILHQIDNHTEAFSVTSAARDLVYLLDVLENDTESSGVGDVYLYGTSYGTYLVERVMHLAPSQVKGYILDGVVSEAGSTPDTRLFFSHWDRNILAPTERFFELCLKQQETCPLQLNLGDKGDVLSAVLDIYNDIDEAMNDCALQLMLLTGVDTPSQILRPILGLLVRDFSARTLIPSILGRMHRCSKKDQKELELSLGPLLDLILQQVGTAASPVMKTPVHPTSLIKSSLDSSVTGSIDQLVYLLISYSELWANPSPTEAELEKLYMDGIFSIGSVALAQYCLLSGNLSPTMSASSRDPACSQIALDFGSNTSDFTQNFVYPVDEYSNITASVPPNTTLLVINGGLDFQTPMEFGRHQYESAALSDPETSRKMMVELEFGAHVCGLTATTSDDETLCGPRIVTSFIANNGDPELVDTSCMNALPELELNDKAFSMLVESIIETEREQMLKGFDFEE
ncbi:serine protease family S33, putative [Phytophthora infestans T30-4]|uniref:Serine protease family S33, putative n=1 Tax=Phytophthora infestans (strain T30-4) TaxID=403677 RepID=D0N0V6_PHYIT|nr:serine protease family S33, putative [Phytophthora infestans T30-4]EEY67269.1 serine protease family S33, putative [Phytophthora infestans T30-4]|eukprot:XP_002905917.1 serine protease family S33, putative [Phytophthora infestans T30-4]